MTTESSITGAPVIELGATETATDAAEFHSAFKRVEHEIKAVDQSRLLTINVDLRTVVTTIVGAYPEIIALRPIMAGLQTFDIAYADKLLDYALALGHAHTLYMLSTETRDDMVALSSEGISIRDQLRADAAGLAKRGLVNPDLLVRLQNGVSYRAIAFDLVAISETLLAAWPRLQGKVAFTQEDLTQARTLGNRMVKLVGQRDQAPAVKDKAAVLRQQAFTLCAETYEDVRFAVSFARRKEGDADHIAPSLFLVRGRSRKEEEVAVAVEPAVNLPGTAGDAAGANALLTTNDVPAAANAVPVGHRGASPFLR